MQSHFLSKEIGSSCVAQVGPTLLGCSGLTMAHHHAGQNLFVKSLFRIVKLTLKTGRKLSAHDGMNNGVKDVYVPIPRNCKHATSVKDLGRRDIIMGYLCGTQR